MNVLCNLSRSCAERWPPHTPCDIGLRANFIWKPIEQKSFICTVFCLFAPATDKQQ